MSAPVVLGPGTDAENPLGAAEAELVSDEEILAPNLDLSLPPPEDAADTSVAAADVVGRPLHAGRLPAWHDDYVVG